MQVTIFPSVVSGTVKAPPSKSVMQRACAAALIAGGTTRIFNYGLSNDDKAALDIIRQLGATVNAPGDYIEIIAPDLDDVHKESKHINCGESGLSVRMFTPLSMLFARSVTIEGSGSLSSRPLDFFDKVLPELGISCNSNAGHLPLKLEGNFTPAAISVDGSLSSQFLTGLLLSFSVTAAAGTEIRVQGLNSKPYIDLTLGVMEAFGLPCPQHSNYEIFTFSGKKTKASSPRNYTVEGDWSNAAFLLVAGAVAGNITVQGLDAFSSQADKKILEALQDSGCILSIEATQVSVSATKLKAFHFDATDCPDLFPPLVVLAAFASGTSVIEGVSRLLHKESNRALSLSDTFAQLGVEITLQDNNMLIKGGKAINGATVHSHNDHRIAMATAIAALGATSPVTITGADTVNKSYPDFFETLRQMAPQALPEAKA